MLMNSLSNNFAVVTTGNILKKVMVLDGVDDFSLCLNIIEEIKP